MNKIKKIGTLEAIAFMIIVMINRIILNTPKEIIGHAGSSSWINVILVSIIAVIFVIIIYKLYKNFSGKDIFDISKYLGGEVFKKITSTIFFLLFLLACAIILRNFCDSLQSVFLENTPLPYILAFFLIAIIIANKLGFSAIIKFNIVIVALVLISIIIIFIFPISHFNFSNLFPILGYDINKTFFAGLSNIFAFSGIAYLYFLMPFLKKAENFKKIALSSVIISSIYLFLSVLTLLGLFSYFINSEDMLSILLITRIISVGSFFQRVDAIFILLWILAFMSYLSILFYFILYSFKNMTNISNQNGMLYSFIMLLFGLTLLPKNIIEVNFLENEILKYSIIIIIFIFPIILLSLANIKHKKKTKLPKGKEVLNSESLS